MHLPSILVPGNFSGTKQTPSLWNYLEYIYLSCSRILAIQIALGVHSSHCDSKTKRSRNVCNSICNIKQIKGRANSMENSAEKSSRYLELKIYRRKLGIGLIRGRGPWLDRPTLPTPLMFITWKFVQVVSTPSGDEERKQAGGDGCQSSIFTGLNGLIREFWLEIFP